MEIENNVKKKLAEMGVPYDSLKPKIKDYLNQIESVIEAKRTERSDAINALQGSLNLKSIADATAISRTTYYNNDILKKYIDHSLGKIDSENPYEMIEKLKKDKVALQEQIDQFISRDVDIQILKHEKKELAAKVKEDAAEIQRLHERINRLSVENDALKSKNRRAMN